MKLIFTLVCCCLFMNNVVGQFPDLTELDVNTIPKGNYVLSTETPDRQMSSETRGTLGPFSTYYDRTTKLTNLFVTVNGQGPYYLSGTNPFYKSLGVKFDCSTNYSILGFLIAFAALDIRTFPDSSYLILYKGDGLNGLPKTNLGYSAFFMYQIDTNYQWTYLKFKQGITVDTNFVAFVQTYPIKYGEIDIFSIYTNAKGDGNNEERAVIINFNNQAATLSAFWSTAGLNIDIDPIIIPIVDENDLSGIDEPSGIDGVNLKGSFPNPAENITTIKFSVDNPTYMDINLIEMSGKQIKNIHIKQLSEGDNEIEIDLTDVPAGEYIYIINTKYGRIGSILNVVK